MDPVSLIGGAALGAPFAEALSMIVEDVKHVLAFRERLKKLVEKMERILPVSIELSQVHGPQQGVGQLTDLMTRTQEIVDKCSNVKWYSILRKDLYSKKMKRIEEDLKDYCITELLLYQHRNQLLLLQRQGICSSLPSNEKCTQTGSSLENSSSSSEHSSGTYYTPEVFKEDESTLMAHTVRRVLFEDWPDWEDKDLKTGLIGKTRISLDQVITKDSPVALEQNHSETSAKNPVSVNGSISQTEQQLYRGLTTETNTADGIGPAKRISRNTDSHIDEQEIKSRCGCWGKIDQVVAITDEQELGNSDVITNQSSKRKNQCEVRMEQAGSLASETDTADGIRLAKRISRSPGPDIDEQETVLGNSTSLVPQWLAKEVELVFSTY